MISEREAAPPVRSAGMLDALEDAADRILERWRKAGRIPFLLETNVEDEIRGVIGAVVEAAETEKPPRIDRSNGFVAQRQVLELLHSEVVRTWSLDPPEESRSVLGFLRATEHVRTAISSENVTDDVAELLAGPDGMSLVAEVAHDLRSPLTAVLFLSDTLRRGHSGPLNDVQLRQMGLIYSASLGLIEIASDLIELARGGDRLADDERRVFSIAETFESVRGIVQPMAEEKELELRFRATTPDRRNGHPVALSRAILNLASNAIKFTDAGYVEIVADANDLHTVIFSIRDTGRGIPEEALDSLFTPFRTRPDHGYHFSGTGLGLTIARRLVRAMDSELEFETQPGKGTRFHFQVTLPPAFDD